MALTTYTTYDAVRAVLGVSVKELKDTTLALSMWETKFLLEMSDVDQGGGLVITQYNTIAGLAVNTRSADQQRFFDMVNMLACYSVARQLLSPAAMFTVKKVTDGKASIERFDASNFDRVRAGVEGAITQLLKRLASLLVVLVPAANVPAVIKRTMIATVGLGTDPVTGL